MSQLEQLTQSLEKRLGAEDKKVIGNQIQTSFAGEIAMVTTRRDLFLPPPDVAPILQLTEPAHWKKFVSYHQSATNLTNLWVHVIPESASFSKIDSSVDQLSTGNWTCEMTRKNGELVPLRIIKNGEMVKVEYKIRNISDEEFTAIAKWLSQKTGVDKGKDTDQTIQRDLTLQRIREGYMFSAFLESPQLFYANYAETTETMCIPNRIMTTEEMGKYIKSVSAVKGRAIKIGDQGFRSYGTIRVYNDEHLVFPQGNPEGLGMEYVYLDNKDLPDGTTKRVAPMPVSSHGKLFGWVILNQVSYGTALSEVYFDHGNDDLVWLQRAGIKI